MYHLLPAFLLSKTHDLAHSPLLLELNNQPKLPTQEPNSFG